MELPVARNFPTLRRRSPYPSSPPRRSTAVNSILFLFFGLLGLFTLVLRRVLSFGDPSSMLDHLGTRELWVPWGNFLLPHRKRESSDEVTAFELAQNLGARLVVGVISGSNHGNRVKAAQNTWMTSMNAQTDAVVFFSDITDPLIPSVGIAGTGASWGGAQSRWLPALSYLHGTYRDAEWFMIVDDDTFLIPEGLKRMLSRHDRTKRLYLGRIMFTPKKKQQEMEEATKKDEPMVPFAHGGSGVLLSRSLLDALAPQLALAPSSCVFSGYGDGDLGYCINRKLNVSVTHEACLHSSIPEDFEGKQDIFVPISDLAHPCTFHYAFRGAGDEDDKNNATMNRMVEWQQRYNSEAPAVEEGAVAAAAAAPKLEKEY